MKTTNGIFFYAIRYYARPYVMSVPGCDNSCLEFRFPLEEAASWEQSVVDRIIPDNDLINLFPLSPEQCLLQGVNEFPVPRSRHSLNNWRGCEQREEKYVIIEILVCNGVMYPWSFLGGRNVAGWMLLTWLNGIAHMYDLIQWKKNKGSWNGTRNSLCTSQLKILPLTSYSCVGGGNRICNNMYMLWTIIPHTLHAHTFKEFPFLFDTSNQTRYNILIFLFLSIIFLSSISSWFSPFYSCPLLFRSLFPPHIRRKKMKT